MHVNRVILLGDLLEDPLHAVDGQVVLSIGTGNENGTRKKDSMHVRVVVSDQFKAKEIHDGIKKGHIVEVIGALNVDANGFYVEVGPHRGADIRALPYSIQPAFATPPSAQYPDIVTATPTPTPTPSAVASTSSASEARVKTTPEVTIPEAETTPVVNSSRPSSPVTDMQPTEKSATTPNSTTDTVVVNTVSNDVSPARPSSSIAPVRRVMPPNRIPPRPMVSPSPPPSPPPIIQQNFEDDEIPF